MKNITCFSTHTFEREYLEKYSKSLNAKMIFTDKRLDEETVHLASGSEAILCWANDKLDASTLELLKLGGTKMISLRSAGYSQMDLSKARELDFTVTRVPSYSPESIAEHAAALYMALNRQLPKAMRRIKDFNFSLEGLQGHQVFGKTVGVIGAGLIGHAFIRIMLGFGCHILIKDEFESEEFTSNPKVEYVELNDLLKRSDLISLHCPLTEKSHHILNKETMGLLKPSATIINTGRGALINTKDLIDCLKKKSIGAVGLDVYEFEEDVFFHDFSENGINDDDLIRLMSFPNVLITSHQAFFTYEALENMAKTSLENVFHFINQSPIEQKNIITSNS